jgi:uncharacterized membrane protein YfcA
MGYGTTLTPVLLLLGFSMPEIVPSVLLSEFLTGTLAGLLHHEFGNVNLKPGSRPFKVTAVLAACSVVGTVAAVFIAISVPRWILKAYVGLLVLAMGLTILFTVGKTYRFSWGKVVGLGLVAALNKGLSGGGYGPLVCGGQVLSGVSEKEAISITSLAEGLVCLVGVVTYLLTGGNLINWHLAPSLALGALLSVPLATLTVSKIPLKRLRWAIGFAVAGLGAFTLINIVL